MMTLRFAWLTCVLLASSLEPTALGTATLADRQRVQENLKRYWESLDTLEFKESEVFFDGDQVDVRRPQFDYEVATASDGRRAMKIRRGDRIVLDVRMNGKKQFSSQYFRDGGRNNLSDITISDQTSRHDEYRGVSCAMYSVISPFGQPLHRFIETAESFEVRKDADGREFIEVVSPYENNSVYLELDPGHDFLPRKISRPKAKPPLTIEVTEFTKVGGRWFPSRGVKVIDATGMPAMKQKNAPPQVDRRKFTVEDIRLNQPVIASAFDSPKAASGVLVTNEATRKSTVVDGLQARTDLERKLGIEHKHNDGPQATPYVVVASAACGAIIFGLIYLKMKR